MKPDRWRRICEALSDDVKFLGELAPVIEDHASRSDGISLPIGGTGSGGGSQLDYSNTTEAAALRRFNSGDDQANPYRRGGPYEEQGDKAALRAVRKAALALSDAINIGLASRAPAAATALRLGRPATSGRDQVEVLAEQEHRRAVYSVDQCLVCDAIADTKLGLCTTKHYFQWRRSKECAEGADRAAWVARARRAYLIDELVGRGIYGQDLEDLSIPALEEIVAGKRRPPRPRERDWDPTIHSSIGPADGRDRRKR